MKKTFLSFAIVLILFACKQEVTTIEINVNDHGIVANTKQGITAKINKLVT